MSSAITFYFKEIYPTAESFNIWITDELIADLTNQDNLNFSNYLYKILFRKYHNSNIQYDTINDFKCDFANKIEDIFTKYQKQLELIKKINNLTDAEIMTISTAIANSANNPNTTVDDPTKPLDYVGAQAYTIANTGKLQAYLQALRLIPTKLIDELLLQCRGLFKTIIPNQINLFGGEENVD